MSLIRRRTLALTATVGLLMTMMAPVSAAANSADPSPRPTHAPAWATDNTIDTNRFDATRGAGKALSAAASAAPAEGSTAPPDATATAPAEDSTAPPDDSAVAPAEASTAPPDATATAPAEASTAPPDDSAVAPAEGSTAPPDDSAAAPAEDSTAPPDDSAAAPAEDSTAPPDDSAAAPATAPVDPLTYDVGDVVPAVTIDTAFGALFADLYTVKAIGTHIEVWVQNDLSFFADDPSTQRPTPVITDAQIAYMVEQFDNNIYPKESAFWRTPALRDGTNAALDEILGLDPDTFQSSDGRDRVIAKIENIEDENFYDSTFPLYVAGFFSPDVNFYIDRNVITIDALDWANRLGGSDAPWRPDDGTANDVNFLYEATFAHEYQHLLHGDQDPAEESWVNEGLSMWTEWLVGYGIPQDYVDEAQANGENSLVIWGDQGDLEIITDYGEAFLFMHYLYTHYGEGAMQALFESQHQGIAGVNDALAAVHARHTSFGDVYHNFAIARLILSDVPGHPKGVYNIPDVHPAVVLRNPDGSINPQAFDKPGAPPWGSDYLLLNDPQKIRKLTFDGLDLLTLQTGWTAVDDPLGSGQSVLWSGAGDMQDRGAIFAATGGGTLSFMTLYDLEEIFDFGIVQVSNDNGATWTTLSNDDTTSDAATNVPAILDNLPGLTGFSGGWVPESYSLAAYAGQSILISFRWMSDQGVNGNTDADGNPLLVPPNWYIDDVMVDSTPISDGTDASVFKDITFYQPIDLDFTVDLVTINTDRHGEVTYKVFHVRTDSRHERSRPIDIKNAMSECSQAILIVTFDALQGQANYAPYTVKIDMQGPKHRHHDSPHRYIPPRPWSRVPQTS